jgi:hypothetical protein
MSKLVTVTAVAPVTISNIAPPVQPFPPVVFTVRLTGVLVFAVALPFNVVPNPSHTVLSAPAFTIGNTLTTMVVEAHPALH